MTYCREDGGVKSLVPRLLQAMRRRGAACRQRRGATRSLSSRSARSYMVLGSATSFTGGRSRGCAARLTWCSAREGRRVPRLLLLAWPPGSCDLACDERRLVAGEDLEELRTRPRYRLQTRYGEADSRDVIDSISMDEHASQAEDPADERHGQQDQRERRGREHRYAGGEVEGLAVAVVPMTSRFPARRQMKKRLTGSSRPFTPERRSAG